METRNAVLTLKPLNNSLSPMTTRTYKKQFPTGGTVSLEIKLDDIDVPVLDGEGNPVEELGKVKTENRFVFTSEPKWLVEPQYNVLKEYGEWKKECLKDFCGRVKRDAPKEFAMAL